MLLQGIDDTLNGTFAELAPAIIEACAALAGLPGLPAEAAVAAAAAAAKVISHFPQSLEHDTQDSPLLHLLSPHHIQSSAHEPVSPGSHVPSPH